jgi:DNA-binding transcriptional MocR family regulator
LDRRSVIASRQLASMLGAWSAGSGSLYAQLSAAVSRLITDGVLRDGDRLPPERALAAELDVSRGTVVSAYRALAEAGAVERIQGSGTTVRTTETLEPTAPVRIGDPLFAVAPRSIDLLVAMPTILPRVLDLVGTLDLAAHAEHLDDDEPAGIAPLRSRIADRMTEDGLPTSPSQVLVTAGAQQGIVLCALLLTAPGDVVLHESPTWPGLIDTVTRLGGRTHGIEMDGDGIVVEALRSAIERMRPAYIALNPHHHNPTGTRLSPRRRSQVAELASSYGVPLLEDRVVTRLAFDRNIPRPLAAEVDESMRGRHIVVDSVNKAAWPGLRVGWVRADAQLISELRSLRAMSDLYSSIQAQLAALPVLDDLDAVVTDRVAHLRTRADRLVECLAAELPDWHVPRPRGGMVLWVPVPAGSAAAFAAHAARYGVQVASGQQFGAPDDAHLRIPYTASLASLEEGVRRLAAAWREFDPETQPPLSPTAVV